MSKNPLTMRFINLTNITSIFIKMIKHYKIKKYYTSEFFSDTVYIVIKPQQLVYTYAENQITL